MKKRDLSLSIHSKSGQTRKEKRKNRDHFRLEADPTDKPRSGTTIFPLFHVGRAKRRVCCEPPGRLASLQL